MKPNIVEEGSDMKYGIGTLTRPDKNIGNYLGSFRRPSVHVNLPNQLERNLC